MIGVRREGKQSTSDRPNRQTGRGLCISVASREKDFSLFLQVHLQLKHRRSFLLFFDHHAYKRWVEMRSRSVNGRVEGKASYIGWKHYSQTWSDTSLDYVERVADNNTYCLLVLKCMLAGESKEEGRGIGNRRTMHLKNHILITPFLFQTDAISPLHLIL